MKKERFSVSTGSETLAGLHVSPSKGVVKGSLLFLHGAGKATKERAEPLADRLAEEFNLASVLFDFSGHGESSGKLQESSLEKRALEAMMVIASGSIKAPFGICAFSMGGHVALDVSRRCEVASLTLFYPAVYRTDVAPIHFGNPLFTKAIREENSWQDSLAFEWVNLFKGSLLVVMGEEDKVIPFGVIDKLIKESRNSRRKELIIVERAPHLLLSNVLSDRELSQRICLRIAESLET